MLLYHSLYSRDRENQKRVKGGYGGRGMERVHLPTSSCTGPQPPKELPRDAAGQRNTQGNPQVLGDHLHRFADAHGREADQLPHEAGSSLAPGPCRLTYKRHQSPAALAARLRIHRDLSMFSGCSCITSVHGRRNWKGWWQRMNNRYVHS